MDYNYTRNDYKGWLGCLLYLLIPIGLYFGCGYCESQSRKEREEATRLQMQKDSIHRAFIQDSLANDPHYQDSLRKAKEDYQAWHYLHDSLCRNEIVGFVFEGDSIYHNYIHGVIEKEDGMIHNYSLNEIPKTRFVTNCDIESENLHKCYDCKDAIEEYVNEHIEDFYYLFEDDDDY